MSDDHWEYHIINNHSKECNTVRRATEEDAQEIWFIQGSVVARCVLYDTGQTNSRENVQLRRFQADRHWVEGLHQEDDDVA